MTVDGNGTRALDVELDDELDGDSVGTGSLIGRRLGDYLIEGLLGTGGMAEVYLAREPALEREVAVKVLPASLAHDRGYVRRFREEAQRVAALEHPHIVQVFYYSERGPLLYLVMPVLKESLRDRLQREQRLEAGEAIRVVKEIADGLSAAHAQGLIHRDVKPENILLDGTGRALLTDFGIAREASLARQGGAQTLSGTGLPVGTPEYMAPEQLRNESLDARADIYALGVVLYELLTGRTPHEAPTPYEVAALALTQPIRPPSERNPLIWPALEQVILKALATRPEVRFQTADEFAAALAEAEQLAAVPLPGMSRATRRLTRPLELPETPEEIAAADTVPVMAIVRPGVTVRMLRSLQRQRLMLAGSLVALLLLAMLGSGMLALFGGFTLAGAGSQTVYLPGETRIIVATPLPSTTAAALATAISEGTPGARATATALATAISEGTPGVTASPSGTATASPTDTPTPQPTPQPTVAPVPGAPLTMTGIALYKVSKGTCEGNQTINNTSNSVTVGWNWSSVPTGFHWSLAPDQTMGQSGPPKDPGLAPGSSDTLYVKVPCGTYSVTVVDYLGNTYPAVSMHQVG